MTTPVQEETPFVVTVPNLGASPFRDDTSVEPEILPAVEAFVAATEEMARVRQEVERITAQRGLNDFGKREAFTEQVAKRVLPVLKRHEAAPIRAPRTSKPRPQPSWPSRSRPR